MAPKEPQIVAQLEQQGADPDRVKEVANMALMIKELRKKNKEAFPGAIDQAIVALKKELVMVLESSGGAWAIRQIKVRVPLDPTLHVYVYVYVYVPVCMLCICICICVCICICI